MHPLRVLIVGCGRIAGGFDYGRPRNDLPYSHAGAYLRDGRFSLAMCVEPNEKRRRAFMHAWGVPKGVSSIEEAVAFDNRFDVVSICSPTKCHMHDLAVAIQLRPRILFCEKPVTSAAPQTEFLVGECSRLNIPLAVNHTRRWDSTIEKLKAELLECKRGPLRSVTGVYNKGILNNGSHMVDLLHLLIAPMEIAAVGEPVYDFFDDDPTIPAWLKGPQGLPIHLVCGNARDYSVFELQLIFAKAVLTMEEGGMFWRERLAVPSEIFNGYRVLDEGVRRSGGYPGAMLAAVDNLYRAVAYGAPLASTGESALAAQRICEQIRLRALSVQQEGNGNN